MVLGVVMICQAVPFYESPVFYLLALLVVVVILVTIVLGIKAWIAAEHRKKYSAPQYKPTMVEKQEGYIKKEIIIPSSIEEINESLSLINKYGLSSEEIAFVKEHIYFFKPFINGNKIQIDRLYKDTKKAIGDLSVDHEKENCFLGIICKFDIYNWGKVQYDYFLEYMKQSKLAWAKAGHYHGAIKDRVREVKAQNAKLTELQKYDPFFYCAYFDEVISWSKYLIDYVQTDPDGIARNWDSKTIINSLLKLISYAELFQKNKPLRENYNTIVSEVDSLLAVIYTTHDDVWASARRKSSFPEISNFLNIYSISICKLK